MGFCSPFFICGRAMELDELLETTLNGMGYELVDVERLAHTRHVGVTRLHLCIAEEHAADLEHPGALDAAGQVVAQHLDQAAHQAGAHH